MSFTIKQYSPHDYDDAWALHLTTIRENEGFVKDPEYHTDFQDIPNYYEAFFIMRDNQNLVGMVGLKRVSPHEGEVKRLQVDPAYQGKGYSKQLMSAVIDYAREKGITTLSLDLSVSFKKACNLYKKIGFETTREETFKGDNGELYPTIFMQMNLAR